MSRGQSPGGKLIVFEGLDGSGKSTQSTRLYDRLKEQYHSVQRIEFPRYDSPTGKLIAAYLRGDLGEKQDTPPELAALFYSLDRYQIKWELEELISQGKTIILDRYTASNLAFQGAKIDDISDRENFLSWLGSVESRLPTPAITLYLDVDIQDTSRWVAQRGQRSFEQSEEKDIHERDIGYQQQVQSLYRQLADQLGWYVVSCSDTQTSGVIQPKSPDVVHEEVWEIVSKAISL